MVRKKVGKNNSDYVVLIDTRSKWFNACLITMCFLLLLAVRLQVNQNTTGDEPYYLLMDYSLVHDGDLSLTNNFQHKNFEGFYKNAILTPQGDSKTVKKSYASKGYSSHGIGLPVFLLPGFLIAAKTGSVFMMVALATLVVYLTWLWTRLTTGNRKIAYIAAALLMICYFFNGLVGAIYPDMFIAAGFLTTLILLDKYYKKTTGQAAIGFILGVLLLMHLKTLIFIAPVLLILSYKLWIEKHKLPWLSYVIVAMFTLYYFVTLHQWFGLWNLSTIEGGQSFGANPLHNIPAMLFDSNRGLLVYNPILLLIFVGLPIWLKENPRSLTITLITLLPTIGVLCLIPNWNGAASPTGRYIIEFLPAFIPAIAYVILKLRNIWQRVIIYILAAATFLISLDVTMMRFPYINGNIKTPMSPLFLQIQQHTHVNIVKLLPTYTNDTILTHKYDLAKIIIGCLFIAGLIIYGYSLSVTKKKPLSRL